MPLVLQGSPHRILHLISSPRWTGVAEPAASLAKLQLQAGCQVTAAAIWERSLEEGLERRGIPLARELEIPRRLNPLALQTDILRLRRYIVREKVQVVHCHLLHDHWLAAVAVRPLPTDQRPLLVRTVHRYETMRPDPWHRWLFTNATNLIITVSTEQEGIILHAYPSVRCRLRAIYGGVDPERFRPGLPGAASVRADMGESPDAMVAGIVAHLGYNRGHRWLLKAAPAVVEQVPGSTIWIVGHGEMRDELRTELRATQYKRRVLLAGYRREDLPETYGAFDVGLLLGLGSEGSARAALECMASARPVIAVRKGALIDTITHGDDGFLIEENDVDGLRDALVRVLSDGEGARRMGENARGKVLARFTEHHRYEATEKAYADAWNK